MRDRGFRGAGERIARVADRGIGRRLGGGLGSIGSAAGCITRLVDSRAQSIPGLFACVIDRIARLLSGGAIVRLVILSGVVLVAANQSSGADQKARGCNGDKTFHGNSYKKGCKL